MPRPDESHTTQASPLVTLLVVSTVQFMVPFLLSAVGVALPRIGEELHASAVQLSLIQAAQVLAVATFLLPVGRFADIYGRKKIFITGIFILMITTLLLALVPSIGLFILLRFFQGIGASMIFSTSIAILTSVFPPGRRGRAMGIIVAAVYVGMASGPSISGFIIEYLGWRWIFGFVFMLQIFTITLTVLKLKGEWRISRGERFDWLSSLIFIVSLSMIIIGAIELTDSEWAKWIALIGIVGMVFFVRFQWRSTAPIIDLHLIVENPMFTFSNLATLINYASSFSFIFFFSLYLQFVKGFSPEYTGLLLIVQPLIQASMAIISGRLSDIYPPSVIATIGMAFCAVGLYAATFFTSDSTLMVIIPVSVVMGFALGLFSTPNMTAIMESVTERHVGTASAMVSTMRNIGSLTSSTVIAIIFSIFLGDQSVTNQTIGEFMASQKMAFYIFSVLSLLGMIFSSIKGRLASSIVLRRQARN